MVDAIEVTYTRYTSTKPLSKEYWLVNGVIQKEANALLYKGTAEIVTSTFEEFVEALKNANGHTAFGYGLHSEAYPDKVRIVVNSKADPDNNILARTKEYYDYYGIPGILMLDHDPSEYGQTISPDELVAALIDIHPEFGQVARIIRGSMSAGVRKKRGKPKQNRGFHVYIPVADARGIPSYGEILMDRLWLKGHGFIALAKNGRMLERTLIDGAVFSPERLDFVGAPILKDPDLIYTAPESVYVEGNLLPTKTLPDLTDDELATVEKIKSDAKEAMKPAAEAKQKQWAKDRVAAMVAAGSTEDEARETIDRILSGACQELYGEFLLEFAGGLGTVTVADVLNEPKKYDRKALADPIEGKSYGTTTAKFYWNDGSPTINSQAHGGCKYILSLEPPQQLINGGGDGAIQKAQFRRDQNGMIAATTLNVCAAVDNPPFSLYHIGLDEFRDEIMFHFGDGQWQSFSDVHYTKIRKNLCRQGFKEIKKELIRDAVHDVAYDNAFDSAIEWLEGLKWDGVSRIKNFIADYLGSKNTPYTKAVSLYMWTAMAGRVLSPGCKVDMVPILVGEQGLKKSTAIAALVPHHQFFCEISFNEQEDNLARKMRGTLVAEIAELRGLQTKDEESIKAFVVRRYEKWTPKYKEFTSTFPRRLILIGTTNKDEFLSDDTGNRRWLPLKVTQCNCEKIKEDREQLWAEAAVLYKKSGIAWEEAESLGQLEHHEYKTVEPWEESITAWLKSTHQLNGFKGEEPARVVGGFTTSEVLKFALGMDDSRHNKAGQMAVARVLKKFGYSNAHRKTSSKANATRSRCWTKADAVYDKKRPKD
jgi:predicted P-loop ATPase